MTATGSPAPPPVDTELGETMRTTGLRLLVERYDQLLARSRTRALTPLEKLECSETASAIEQLQATAPTGPVQP